MKDNNRPIYLNDFVGQDKIKNVINIMVQSSKSNNKPFTHTLLHGKAGLGKTTLATIIANELNYNIKIINAASITKTGDIATILNSLQKNDILFIDEIHRLPLSVEEILYQAVEDFKLNITIGKEHTCRIIEIDLEPFTLIGATTIIGKISKPLFTRFEYVANLVDYTIDDIKEIIVKDLQKKDKKLSTEIVEKIASYSRFTPRICKNITNRVLDFIDVNNNIDINDILISLDYYHLGVSLHELEYLKSLYNISVDRPVGSKYISQVLSIDINTIETYYEPYLIKLGLISRTKQGRIITEKGIEYLKGV